MNAERFVQPAGRGRHRAGQLEPAAGPAGRKRERQPSAITGGMAVERERAQPVQRRRQGAAGQPFQGRRGADFHVETQIGTLHRFDPGQRALDPGGDPGQLGHPGAADGQRPVIGGQVKVKVADRQVVHHQMTEMGLEIDIARGQQRRQPARQKPAVDTGPAVIAPVGVHIQMVKVEPDAKGRPTVIAVGKAARRVAGIGAQVDARNLKVIGTAAQPGDQRDPAQTVGRNRTGFEPQRGKQHSEVVGVGLQGGIDHRPVVGTHQTAGNRQFRAARSQRRQLFHGQGAIGQPDRQPGLVQRLVADFEGIHRQIQPQRGAEGQPEPGEAGRIGGVAPLPGRQIEPGNREAQFQRRRQARRKPGTAGGAGLAEPKFQAVQRYPGGTGVNGGMGGEPLIEGRRHSREPAAGGAGKRGRQQRRQQRRVGRLGPAVALKPQSGPGGGKTGKMQARAAIGQRQRHRKRHRAATAVQAAGGGLDPNRNAADRRLAPQLERSGQAGGSKPGTHRGQPDRGARDVVAPQHGAIGDLNAVQGPGQGRDLRGKTAGGRQPAPPAVGQGFQDQGRMVESQHLDFDSTRQQRQQCDPGIESLQMQQPRLRRARGVGHVDSGGRKGRHRQQPEADLAGQFDPATAGRA